jgi:outer membrane protein OmpA-like peptidoglycan-associated protein
MRVKNALLLLVVGAVLFLQGCTLLCGVNCRHVDYYQKKCPPAPCGIFPNPCPSVNVPGFYRSDFNCIERLRKLTTIRQRGVGVIVLGDRLRFILPTDTLFGRDSIESCMPDINDCYLTTLAAIGDIIKCIPCVPVVITGHTDDMGTKQDRFRRSRIMAQAVAAHLWAQGVNWDRLRVIGRADCDPIASDLSVFGSTDNRRIEIRLDFSRNYMYNCRYNNVYCPDCVGDRQSH